MMRREGSSTGPLARLAAPSTLAAMVLLCSSMPSSAVQADPYRLRGDALARAESPVGLLALSADGELYPWLSAEAVVWLGAAADSRSVSDGPIGDVLVIVARARDPRGRGEARLGRFVAVTGALRPLHLDGAWINLRLPWRLRLETLAGIPVDREFSADAYDWAAGGRVSLALGEWGSAGLAYLHRREAGALDDEEIGLDAAYAPLPWLDLAGKVAVDLIDPGVAEAHASTAIRRGPWRLELFALHRSPSRLLPATSLFSTLGDVPSQQAGLSARWRTAPRLDVDASLAVRRIDDSTGTTHGESLSLRAVLRLDDRGASALSLEARRERVPGPESLDAGWIGVRGTARVVLRPGITAAAEVELVRPDRRHDRRTPVLGSADDNVVLRDRGALWPWGLVAVRWQPGPHWQLAGAIEASASPEYRSRFDALIRASRSWEVP